MKITESDECRKAVSTGNDRDEYAGGYINEYKQFINGLLTEMSMDFMISLSNDFLQSENDTEPPQNGTDTDPTQEKTSTDNK